MSDTALLLTDSLDRLLRQHCPAAIVLAWEEGCGDGGVWHALEEMGLPLLLVPEENEGAGGDMVQGVAVVRRAAYHCAPVPLAETLLAERLAAAAGWEPLAGTVALMPAATARLREGRLTDTGEAVPWAGAARACVAVARSEDGPCVVRLAAGAVQPAGRNLAGEPRGRVPEGAEAETVAPLPEAFSPDRVRALGALLRAAQLCGAMDRAIEMAIRHVADREQFGRPLNRFQAVQHGLAVAAGHAAAAGIAVDAAAAAADAGDARFEIAVAKARAGEAAGLVAAATHQLHGAMGFTRDYPLNLATRRLWAWRDEFGSETEWQAWLGREVAAAGGDELWALLTART